MEKLKTIKVPLKQMWSRDEYVDCRFGTDKFNVEQLGANIPIRDDKSPIPCSFCSKKIESQIINVVEYGESVACDWCFKARYWNRRQIYKHIVIPPDLNPAGATLETDEELAQREAEKVAGVEKAVDIQNSNVTQIREKFSKVDSAEDLKQS